MRRSPICLSIATMDIHTTSESFLDATQGVSYPVALPVEEVYLRGRDYPYDASLMTSIVVEVSGEFAHAPNSVRTRIVASLAFASIADAEAFARALYAECETARSRGMPAGDIANDPTMRHSGAYTYTGEKLYEEIDHDETHTVAEATAHDEIPPALLRQYIQTLHDRIDDVMGEYDKLTADINNIRNQLRRHG